MGVDVALDDITDRIGFTNLNDEVGFFFGGCFFLIVALWG
jgi:hypothetical protein